MCLAAMLAVSACGKRPDDHSTGGSGGSGSGEKTDDDPKGPPPPPTVKTSSKGDCKTDYAPRPKRDPNPMCKVAGGTFVMTDPTYGKDPPSMTVTLSPYYIDQFEVTVAQVAFYLNATHGEACTEPDMPSHPPCFAVAKPEGERKRGLFVRKLADGTFQPEPGTERFPYQGASRMGAMNYCKWAGKSLPTEPQWEFAARHDPTSGKELLYPWGDEFDGKRARCMHDLCSDGPDNDEPALVGTYDGSHGHADGSSPWGLYDMAGNVTEIVADCLYDYTPCGTAPCKDPAPHGPQPKYAPWCKPITRSGGMSDAQQLRTISRDTASGVIDGFRCAH